MMERLGLGGVRHMAAPLMAVILVAGACGAGPASPSPSSAAASPLTQSAIVARATPTGATAPVDEGAWALADRIAAPTYTADTTAAFKTALARAGIAVVPDTSTDPATAVPEIPLTAVASPFELLDFQAHALAVGTWAGATWSGAELDSVVPLPEGTSGVPPTSALLAAYVASSDSPGGALSRAVMAGQDLLQPATLRFPAVVLALFVSDLATDGGRVAMPGSSPRAGVQEPDAELALARTGSHAFIAQPAIDLGTICAGPDGWIDAIIAKLEAALTPTSTSVVGAVLIGAFHWLVHVAVTVVKGIVDAITAPVRLAIQSIALMISGVAVEIASLLPYSVHVVATGGETGGATFNLGADPKRGTYTAFVSAGDLPDWPSPLASCAAAAGVPLPDFTPTGIHLTFGPVQAPGDPLLGPTDQAVTDTVTDASGQASWPFLTSPDPGDAAGEDRNQLDYMPVAVHRPELDELRAKLTEALFGTIPDLLRPSVVAIFKPLLDSVQSRIDALLDARGRGSAVLRFHTKAPPTPVPSVLAMPTAASACGSSVPAGTYAGTYSFDLTMDQPPVTDHTTGRGPASLTVASDGTITGTINYEAQRVYDATVAKLHDHEESSYTMTGLRLGGSICDLTQTIGQLTVQRCTDSVFGDCRPTTSPPAISQTFHSGPPTDVRSGHLGWSATHADAENGTTSSWTLTLTGP